MLNMIKADIYRIFRSKGFYITLGVLLFMIILQAATGVRGNVGVNSYPTDITQEQLNEIIALRRLTAAQMFLFSLQSAQNLIYFFLPVFCIITSLDFSSGAVKNAVCYGVSREKYYLAKLLMAAVSTVAFSAASTVIFVLFGLIFNGAGNGLNAGEFFAGYFLQLLLMLAFMSIGIFFAITTKKTAAACGAYIAFCIMPSIILLILSNLSDSFKVLFDYEMVSMLSLAADVGSLKAGGIVRVVLMGIGFLAASTASGMLLFRKAEIK